MSRDAPTHERLRDVADAVKAQMAQVRLSGPEVIDLSGLSEKSFYDILHAKGNPNKTTLVALSAALGLNSQYLHNVISGNAVRNAISESPPEEVFARMTFDRLAEVASKSDVVALSDTVHDIDTKIDVIISRLGPGDDDLGSE